MKDACNLGFTWYVHGAEKLRIGGKTIPVVLKIIPEIFKEAPVRPSCAMSLSF